MHYAYERVRRSSAGIAEARQHVLFWRRMVARSACHPGPPLGRTYQAECLGLWLMSDESDMAFSGGRVAICARQA